MRLLISAVVTALIVAGFAFSQDTLIKNRHSGSVITIPNNVVNVRATESTNQLLNISDNRHQIFSVSTGLVVTLPGTGVKKGEVWFIEERLQNTFPDDEELIIEASGGEDLTVANGINFDATINNGYVRLIALQDDPTTAASWHVTEVNERHEINPTVSGANVQTFRTSLTRSNDQVVLTFNNIVQGSCASSPSIGTAAAALPVRFRPHGSDNNNNAIQFQHLATDAAVYVEAYTLVRADGSWETFKVSGTNFTSTTNCSATHEIIGVRREAAVAYSTRDVSP